MPDITAPARSSRCSVNNWAPRRRATWKRTPKTEFPLRIADLEYHLGAKAADNELPRCAPRVLARRNLGRKARATVCRIARPCSGKPTFSLTAEAATYAERRRRAARERSDESTAATGWDAGTVRRASGKSCSARVSAEAMRS